MAFDMKKFLGRFVEEARDHVEKLNTGLVTLEKEPEDAENINSIFRSAHTIKGSSRMMKLTSITEVAHKLEDVLGALREKKIAHSKPLADLLFRGVDALSEMIEKTSAGEELTADNSGLCEELADAAGGAVPRSEEKTPPAAPSPPVTQATPIADEPSPPEVRPEPVKPVEPPPVAKEARPAKTSETVRINSEKLDELIKLMGEIVSNQNRLKQRRLDVKEVERATKRHLEMLLDLPEELSGEGAREALVNSAHALYLKAASLHANVKDDANISELLTDELQAKALTLRMIPLSTVFDSLHRMMRDISRSLGKEVAFTVEGGEIELDKKMIDKLDAPLVHMLRNSLDHGIERPEERVKAGKSATGSIRLSACYDAGSVLLELSDDGGGIPVDKIREKAKRKRIFNEHELAEMSEASLIDLIFLPGLSTSPILTDVSGRGVGMDVVKRNIVEDLRGTIQVDTKAEQGTSFFIRLPLTLAVMRILLIEVAGMIFAITAHYVAEIVRVSDQDYMNVVGRRAIRLRNEFIPVADLASVLRLPGEPAARGKDSLVIIVRMSNEKLGLAVDTLLDEEDMVIKPLPAHMNKVHLVSGVTISGKNEIINVLNIPAVIEAAREMKESRKPAPGAVDEVQALNVLVVDDSVNTREIEMSILESYGYRVTLAEDGIDGFEKAMEFNYDIVITDVEMPRLDGFSLTERLRAVDSYKETPIIIVTSREKEEDKRRGILVGADAYIVKGSFEQTNLIETIRNLVG
jgi:two-component system chemotaxis sensor kinase CheA